jgi:hypothetical protein
MRTLNRTGFDAWFDLLRSAVVARRTKYPQELRERALRLVSEAMAEDFVVNVDLAVVCRPHNIKIKCPRGNTTRNPTTFGHFHDPVGGVAGNTRESMNSAALSSTPETEQGAAWWVLINVATCTVREMAGPR